MEPLHTIDELCAQLHLTPQQVAERAGLDERRVQAIVAGRWTPSPSERDRVAAVFGMTREQIAWGHRTSVAHIYGHGPQFGRSP
jgi:transcriptional regulator with XRE-family HTH domain